LTWLPYDHSKDEFLFAPPLNVDLEPWSKKQKQYWNRRINQYFIIKGFNSVWVLVDCSAFINMATWTIIDGPLVLSNFKDFGYFDPVNNLQEWKSYVQQNLYKINSKMENWSIAKLLTSKELFNGVGSYLASEILSRIELAPWTKVSF
jgi:hypothetical protein